MPGRPVKIIYENERGEQTEARPTSRASIGRDSKCDLTIAHSAVSRRHAEVLLQDGDWWIVDLDSTNGTYLDDAVIQRAPIKNDAVIRLGKEGPRLTILLGGGEKAEATETQPLRSDVPLYPVDDAGQAVADPSRSEAGDETAPKEETVRYGDPNRWHPSGAPGWLESVPVYQEDEVPSQPEPQRPKPLREVESQKDVVYEALTTDQEFPLAYQATPFSLRHSEEWSDTTVYIFSGTVTDRIRHNITVVRVALEGEPSLSDFTEDVLLGLEASLDDFRLLRKDSLSLHCGLPANRVIFRINSENDRRLYQEQLIVVQGTTGFCLTATFSAISRKLLGNEIEQIMLTFQPGDLPSVQQGGT